MQKIKVVKTTNPKKRPDPKKLGWGVNFTDHMFIMNYTEGEGWHDARVVPYGPLELDPATAVLHYGQEVFEGLKAYHSPDGRILLFRPNMNSARLNRSNVRMAMPEIPYELFLEAIKTLVKVDADWIPTEPETSLYIRPTIIATDPKLGVHPSHTYIFYIILSPVAAYYPQGLNPTKIYVEDSMVRAVPGGTGEAKTGGNYAASLKAQEKAEEKGYTQVLWLDAIEHKYIEEVGAMNVIFKIDGELVTTPLSGSILPGVTRDSVLHLVKDWGIKVSERRISIDEIVKAYDEGKLEEAFGVGTAAVISPIGELNYKGKVMIINDNKTSAFEQKLYDALTAIQWGKVKDPYGWSVEIK